MLVEPSFYLPGYAHAVAALQVLLQVARLANAELMHDVIEMVAKALSWSIDMEGLPEQVGLVLQRTAGAAGTCALLPGDRTAMLQGLNVSHLTSAAHALPCPAS
jgi:hypothetical protein